MRLYMSFARPRAYGKCSVFIYRDNDEIARESITAMVYIRIKVKRN